MSQKTLALLVPCPNCLAPEGQECVESPEQGFCWKRSAMLESARRFCRHCGALRHESDPELTVMMPQGEIFERMAHHFNDRGLVPVVVACRVCGTAYFPTIHAQLGTQRGESPSEERLRELFRRSKEWFEKLTPEEQLAHRNEQRISWVKGELLLSGYSEDEAEAAARRAVSPLPGAFTK